MHRLILTFIFGLAIGSAATWLVLQPSQSNSSDPGIGIEKTNRQEREKKTREPAKRSPKNLSQPQAKQASGPQAQRIDLQPLAGSKATGTLTLVDTGDGVRLDAALRNLAPGRYALEVRENGDCSAPNGASTGAALAAQKGEIGPLMANVMGRAKESFVLDWATLASGENGLAGRAIVVRADGPPVACGVLR